MQKKCEDAVFEAAKAMGRKAPSKAQLADIETRISAAMTRVARDDPSAWHSLTQQQRYQAGAARAMEDIKAEAAKKLEQAQLQIQRTAETEARIQALSEAYKGMSRANLFSRDIQITDRMATAERKAYMGRLMDLIDAATSKQGATAGRQALMALFDAENPQMTGDIVREVFKSADGSTGNKAAQSAARAWLDVIEEMRTRFNAAGGDVGLLDYGYTPQPHDTAKIRKAGADAWAAKTMPLLDRSRYLYEDGSRMSDDDLSEMLRGVYQTLSTEGINKQVPGQFKGSGKRANRGSDSRQIHFADGDAWVNYMREFGRGSIYDAMMGHVGGMARDITLVERYGPDVNGQGRLQLDEARLADGKSASDPLTNWSTVDPETYFRMVTGQVGTPKSEPLARTFSMVRNIQTAAKLGGAIISSVTDLGTLALTAGYNRLPYWQLVKDIAAQGGKDGQEFMAAHGMIADSLADSMNRWSGDHLGTNWSGKMANSVMRWSFLNAWTDGLRGGFQLTMNGALAKMAKKSWAQLDESDRTKLSRAGITEADWSVVQQVKTENYKGRELLTPQGIKDAGDEALAAKVFGLIHDESEYAVVNPDMTARAVSTWGGQQAGTVQGELIRTVMQFKSFPIAMMTRHWRRMLEGDGPMNRVAYGIGLMVTLMGLGAVATQAKQILQGKDPINMNPTSDTGGKFLAKAVMQGGGLSILGDLFLTDPSATFGDQAGNFAKNALGPTVGSASELVLKNISGNIWEAAQGKDTHWEAELAAWAKSNTPGASLWWVKPMIDHRFMNALNENMSPGYLSKMKARAKKDWGQSYWWAPEDTIPDRAPDMAEAFN